MAVCIRNIYTNVNDVIINITLPSEPRFKTSFALARLFIIESVESINRDERGFPLTQYITNGGISRARNTITHFKHHLRVLRLISNRMSV